MKPPATPALLPCPFCGGPAEYEYRPDGYQYKTSASGWHAVSCREYCAVRPHTGYHRKKSRAVRVWNSRHAAKETP